MFNFVRALDRNALRWPDRPAIRWQGTTLTHGQLNARVNAAAGAFADLGIGRGDVVALLMQNRPEFLESALALNKLGAIFLPLNFRLALSEWRYIVEHAGARGIVVSPDYLAAAQQLAAVHDGFSIVCTGAPPAAAPEVHDFDAFVAANLGRTVLNAEVSDDDIQRLMYTSGTTSRPKGVPLTYGNVLWKIFGHVVEFGITSSDRTLIAGPMYHVGALDLPGTGTLYTGGSLVILPAFDAAEVMVAIESERPTNVWLAPAMVNAILQLPDLERYDASSIRFIINGGEKMPVALIERIIKIFPNAWLADAFGMTETVSGDTFLDQDHVLDKIGSVGRPVLHLDVRIEREDGAQAAPGEHGELLLRGPKVFTGYWRDEEATAAAFADGWFRTGDIGHFDADGYLYIDDRKKDMIISGGENIATPEVERVLYQHDAVLEAAVIGMPDPRWQEVPKAVVALRPGASATAEELISFCAEQLAKFKVPKVVMFVDALPRNASGKVLKRELRELS